MSYAEYQNALKEHPRYQEQQQAIAQGKPLRWYQRRAVALGLANFAILIAMVVLEWSMAGVLFVFWGEAIALTTWMVIKKGMQRFWWAIASLGFLLFAFTQLLGLATVEAQIAARPESGVLLASGIAAVLGVAVLTPAHAAPPVARITSVWPQLALVLVALIAGGAMALIVKPGLADASAGLPFLLVFFKAIAQTSLATHRELRAIERVPRQTGGVQTTAPRPNPSSKAPGNPRVTIREKPADSSPASPASRAASASPAVPATAASTGNTDASFVIPEGEEAPQTGMSFQRVSK